MKRRDVMFELSTGQRLQGVEKTIPLPMPTARDTSAAADQFRARNAGKTVTVYEVNLPFATSLEGAGRWTDPTLQNLADLPDGYDGRRVGHIAHQTSGPVDYGGGSWREADGEGLQPFDWIDHGAQEHEDCCRVTIQTPRVDTDARLPVRVNIHGGGNTQNPRHLPRYGGEMLPMVSVLVEYPLSTFGFFTHPSFGPDHQINTAYLVFLKALEWVQLNIREFGGDPDVVTLEGASAGGQAASLLMPHAGGLFHRCMSHSGGGAGKRAPRWRAASRGAQFWRNLIKSGPAYYDPNRTIAEIAEQDGIATALRLGPSPSDILAFGNRRRVYDWAEDGSYSTSVAGDVNIWPALDGEIIRHTTAIAQLLDDAWPVDVPYMATYASNEAGLIGNAREVVNPVDWWRVLGIETLADQVSGIQLIEREGDRWQRRLYGLLYGYGAERLCREHSLRGGRAYLGLFSYDTPGNGRDAPSHVNQQAYFLGKPWWQSAQGTSTETLLLYEADWRCAWACRRAYVNFCAHGDPAAEFDGVDDLNLFDAHQFEGIDRWPEFGGEARHFATIRNHETRHDAPQLKAGRNHEWAFFNFVDERFEP